MLVILSSSAEARDSYSAKGMGDLFKFEHSANFNVSPLGRT
jgi:hypothetical protein